MPPPSKVLGRPSYHLPAPVPIPPPTLYRAVPPVPQDHVYQPYESDGLLPYEEFSIRLGKADVPHIVHLLRALPEERVRQLRLGMARHYG